MSCQLKGNTVPECYATTAAITPQSRANTLATEILQTFGHQTVRSYATLRKQVHSTLTARNALLGWFRLLTSSAERYNSTSSASFVRLKNDDVVWLLGIHLLNRGKCCFIREV